MDIEFALLVDVLLLLLSLWLVLQVSERSIFNPGLWWVALHAYTVTFRLITLNLGVQSLAIMGIRSDAELVNAAIASDISLLAVVGATLFAARKRLENRTRKAIDSRVVKLDPLVGKIISILCLVIGTYALIAFGAAATAVKVRGVEISRVDIGRFEESTYPLLIGGFAVQGGLILCAMRGFTRWSVILLVLLLAMASINPARTSFVTPVLMALLIYLTMRGQRSLPAKWAVGVVILALVWFVYKPVVGAIVTGASPEMVWTSARDYLQDSANSGATMDTQFLDMQATFMAAADEAGVRFYGSTVLPLVYLPIPRFLWRDKPSMAEYQKKITSPSRPIALVGMTPNLAGEGYLEFGWTGCAVIPFFYMLGMQTAFRRVSRLGITSVARWTYLIFLVAMLQIYRDGLISLFMYPFVVYLPLLSWGAISRMLSPTDVRVRHLKLHCKLPAANGGIA
jgi:oligosaccharide repeat unit polymerase